MNARPRREPEQVAWFPANADAERSLLGAVLLRPELLEVCESCGLRADDFSLKANKEIFAALERMKSKGKPIDALLLCEEIDVQGIGGTAYLSDLTSEAIAVESHVRARCAILQRLAELRRILLIAESMESAARQRMASPQDIATRVIGELSRMAATNGR